MYIKTARLFEVGHNLYLFLHRAGRAHAAIESKPPLTWDKGKACNLIMEKIFGSEWHSR
jgi:hypothetical protein